MNLADSSSSLITDAEGGKGTGLGQLWICPSLVPPPQRLFSREMCLSIGPAPLVVHSIPPTLAVDNDLQLLEVETLWGDGTLSPTGQLRANTAGTPGPLWNTTPSITATVSTLKLKNLRSHSRVVQFLNRGFKERSDSVLSCSLVAALLPCDRSSPRGANFHTCVSKWNSLSDLPSSSVHTLS